MSKLRTVETTHAPLVLARCGVVVAMRRVRREVPDRPRRLRTTTPHH